MDVRVEVNQTVLPQNVVAPLTRAAIFLVVCIRQDPDAYALLRSFCADLSGLIRAVEFRDIEAGSYLRRWIRVRFMGQAFWIATACRASPVSRDSVRRPPRYLYPRRHPVPHSSQTHGYLF